MVPVIDVFEKLGGHYCIGGSVPSSAHGIARSTKDIDIIADLHLLHARLLTDALTQFFYVDFAMVQEAIRRSGLENSLPEREFYLASPEDIILNNLEWYRQGGEVSERQWTDVLGVLKVQSKSWSSSWNATVTRNQSVTNTKCSLLRALESKTFQPGS